MEKILLFVPKTRVRQVLKLVPALAVTVISLMLFGCASPKGTLPAQSEGTPAATQALLAPTEEAAPTGAVPATSYHAVIKQEKPIIAGQSTTLNVEILDQLDRPVGDLEPRKYGMIEYYAYVTVAPLDLSSLKAEPIVLGAYLLPDSPAGNIPGEVENVSLRPGVVFPKDGQYIVFVEILPHDSAIPVTLAAPVDVGSAKTQAAVLASDTPLTQQIDGLKVTLKYDGTLKAGQPANINFEVVDAQGKVITQEIEPQSGEHSILYVIDETLTTFQRFELVDHSNLQFSVNFPNPGKYKVWFEFINAGKLQQFAFVLDVK
jgi:hypothetical protein